MNSTSHRILIKFGGNSLGGPGDLERFAGEVAELITHGYQPILVHGGGPEISKEMEARGMQVRKVAGLRVTDETALAVAERSCPQRLHRGRAARQGIEAVRVSAARPASYAGKPPAIASRAASVRIDLGWVGRDRRHRKLDRGHAVRWSRAVIYPIRADADGKRYNVNADTMAAFVAQGAGGIWSC